jgi:hypothetical protein
MKINLCYYRFGAGVNSTYGEMRGSVWLRRTNSQVRRPSRRLRGKNLSECFDMLASSKLPVR